MSRVGAWLHDERDQAAKLDGSMGRGRWALGAVGVVLLDGQACAVAAGDASAKERQIASRISSRQSSRGRSHDPANCRRSRRRLRGAREERGTPR